MKKIKKLLVTVAAVAMAVSLAGCGGGSSTSGEKVFCFGQSNPGDGYDIQKSTNSGVSSVIDNVVEPLIRWNDDNEMELVLLTKFPEVSEDGLTYSFELKEGVKFSDGSDLTSEDVKYTFERMAKIKGSSSYMYNMIVGYQDVYDGKADEITGIEIKDDLHFDITLEYKFAPFIPNIAIDYAVIYPSDACEAAGDKWGTGTNLIGTGPYVIVDNDEKTKVVMEPNKFYHEGTPNLDRLEIVYIDDLSTKMMEYEAGNIDMCDLDVSLLDQYKDSLAGEIHQVVPLGTYFLAIKVDDPAFDDVRVREAISLAIDRQTMCDTVLNGAAEPANEFLNPAIPGHDDSLEPYEYNVDKAKQLLAEAGKSDLEFTAYVRASGQTVMEVVQADLAKAGIKMNLQVLDNSEWAAKRPLGEFPMTTLGWFPLYADADNQMYTYYHSANSYSGEGGKGVDYSNPEFDKLMDEARQTVDDEAKRAELYKQADYILSRVDYGTIPLYYGKLQYVAKPYVKNHKLGNLVYHLYNIDIDLDAK